MPRNGSFFLRNTLWLDFSLYGSTALVGRNLIIKVSRSQSETQHSVGPLCTSDRPKTATRKNTQHSQETDIHALGGIRSRKPCKRAAADPRFNPLNPELNPICCLLALLGAHHFLHVSRIMVKLLTFRLLMSYTYGAPILDVSRSHTTTQHSR